MSAFGGKADLNYGPAKGPLIARSGHSPNFRNCQLSEARVAQSGYLIDGLLRGTRRFNFRYTVPEVQKPYGGHAISAGLVFVETDLRDVAFGGLLLEVDFPG